MKTLTNRDFNLIKICIDRVLDLKIDTYTNCIANTENKELTQSLLQTIQELQELLKKLN